MMDIRNILVVDDTVANLKLMIATLSAAGYEVRPLRDPTRAIETALLIRPDLVVLDIAMPDLDGFALCRAMKAEPRLHDVPIILVSAQGEPLDNARIHRVGADAFIGKPFNLDDLLRRIESLLPVPAPSFRRDA